MTQFFNPTWKQIVACGASISGIIIVIKLPPDAIERLLTKTVGAYKEYVVARNGNP